MLTVRPLPRAASVHCDRMNIRAAENVWIAKAKPPPSFEETVANLQLIAAAPLLLDALEETAKAYGEDRKVLTGPANSAVWNTVPWRPSAHTSGPIILP